MPRLATTRRGKIFWTPSEKKKQLFLLSRFGLETFFTGLFLSSFLPSSPYFLFSLNTIDVFSTHSSTKLPWKRSTNSMEEEEKKLRLIDRIKINSLGAAQLRRVSKRMDKDLCGPATPGKEGRERGRRYRMESLDTAGTMA